LQGDRLAARDDHAISRVSRIVAGTPSCGTTPAEAAAVTEDSSVKHRRSLEAQVEQWTAEAKKLVDSGKETAGLELYRRAADELSGAPWLQHRTAELCRKLKQIDLAIVYFRRASTAFQMAEFPKRAVAPLRTAWSLAIEGLPGTSKLLVEIATELMQLHRRLGFMADATVTLERTNAVLRARGFSEMAPQLSDFENATVLSGPRAVPPSSPSNGPKSDVAPRQPVVEAAPGARTKALARMFGRR
jgi:hypothetical protein